MSAKPPTARKGLTPDAPFGGDVSALKKTARSKASNYSREKARVSYYRNRERILTDRRIKYHALKKRRTSPPPPRARPPPHAEVSGRRSDRIKAHVEAKARPPPLETAGYESVAQDPDNLYRCMFEDPVEEPDAHEPNVGHLYGGMFEDPVEEPDAQERDVVHLYGRLFEDPVDEPDAQELDVDHLYRCLFEDPVEEPR